MKSIQLLLITLSLSALSLTTTSCKEEKGPAAKVGDKIDDALNQRPGEKVRDAVEDVKSTPGKIGDKVDDALDRRPGEKVRDVIEDVTEKK